jgi:conjugative transfer signal peptidase TraF
MPGQQFNRSTNQGTARIGLLCCSLVVLPVLGVTICGLGGMRFNATPSVPIGIYWISSEANSPFVEFCPPEPFGSTSVERGYRPKTSIICSDGGEPLLKPIIARSGDSVEMSPRGISVNGIPVPNTAPRALDSEGRSLKSWPFGRYRVPPDSVWVASSYNSRSFDSRYFGPIRGNDIRHRLRPIWTE